MKRKIQVFALVLMGIMLSSNLWADYTVSLNGEGTGLSNAGTFSSTTQNGVTVSADKNGGTQTAYYTSGDAVRFYAKNKMTVSFGSAMTQIVINYGSKSNAITSASVGSIGTYNGTAKTQTWTGSATSVTFTFGGTKGNDQITSVVVTAGGSKYTLLFSNIRHRVARLYRAYHPCYVFSWRIASTIPLNCCKSARALCTFYYVVDYYPVREKMQSACALSIHFPFRISPPTRDKQDMNKRSHSVVTSLSYLRPQINPTHFKFYFS